MPTSAPTVLVAAAPTLHRAGLVALLQEQWPHLRLSLTADATQVPHLARSQTYEVIILDGHLPGLPLAAVLTQLHQSSPTQRLLLLTGVGGACVSTGPLPWPGTRLQASRSAWPGNVVALLAPWLDGFESEHSPVRGCASPADEPFSPRELQVLGLVVADHCNQEIADRLCLSVRTVESHRRNLIQKAGTRTLVGLAARAVREGWVA